MRGYSFLVERGASFSNLPSPGIPRKRSGTSSLGYRRRNQHFEREITDSRLFCHANRFEKAPGKPVKFEGLSIGCERCHAPESYTFNTPSRPTAKIPPS